MKKIAVIGCPGSGKSTLCARLGEITGLPVVFLDAIYHTSAWDPDTKKQDWRNLMRELVEKSEWIIDGNYKGTLDIRVPSADTIVFLDFPRWLCLYRVIQRRIGQLCGHPARGGNPERLELDFLRFIWGYRRIERPKVIAMLEQKKEGVFILKTPSEVETFLLQQSAR